MEKIGLLKEVVFEKVGRIHPVDEVEGIGNKVKVEISEEG